MLVYCLQYINKMESCCKRLHWWLSHKTRIKVEDIRMPEVGGEIGASGGGGAE